MGAKLPPFSISEEDGLPVVWQPWQIRFSNGTVTDNGDGTVSVNITASTGGAPTTATYITQTPDGGLSAEQALNQLNTGLLKNTSGTGVLVIASGGVDFENILSAGSPILRRANLFFLNTDGNTANFLNGAGVFTIPSGGGSIAYAPSGSTYIVQTNDAVLSNEQVLAALSSGLLKNTAVTGVLTIASGGVDFQTVLSASSPILFNGTAIGIQASGAAQDGYLSQSNFNLFNAKVATSRSITIVAPLSGGGDLSANRVIAILSSTATSDGYLKSVDFALFNAKASTSRTINTLSPLSGGGDLSADRTISLTTDGSTSTYLRGDGSFRVVYEARSPLLSAGTILSILTDGTTTNFLRGDGTYATPDGGTGLTWAVATVDTTALVNRGYITNSSGLLTVTLPSSASVGDVIRVSGIDGAWKIAQNALQKIYIGNTSTTTGVGGYLQATDTRDALEIVCVQINSSWNVLGMVGNITFV